MFQTLILTHFSNPGVTDIKSDYEGRASLDVDLKAGKANLKLSSITLADNKVFECRVQILGDDEGKPADTARLVVLGKVEFDTEDEDASVIGGEMFYSQLVFISCFLL